MVQFFISDGKINNEGRYGKPVIAVIRQLKKRVCFQIRILAGACT